MTVDDIIYQNYILNIGFDTIYLNSNVDLLQAVKEAFGISFDASADIGYQNDTVFLLLPDEFLLFKDVIPKVQSWVLLRNPNNDEASWLYDGRDNSTVNRYTIKDGGVALLPVQKIPDLYLYKIPKNTLLDLIVWKDKLGRDWLCIDKDRGLFILNAPTDWGTTYGIPYYNRLGRKSYTYEKSNARKNIREFAQNYHLDLIPDDVDYLKVPE